MNYFFSQLVLLSWFPIAIVLFSVMPKRRALIIGITASVMFLPMSEYPIPFIPFTKLTIVPLGLFVAMLLMDPSRLASFRPHAIDLPMVMIVLTPIASSLTNGLRLYDGTAAGMTSFITMGMPYLMGRVYLADFEGLRELAVVLFVGGLVYVPFCLFEMHSGPECHHLIYGFYQHDYIQAIRLGGIRPIVFMQHGLMLSFFMTAATLSGVWLWRTGAIKKIRRIPVGPLVAVLAITTLLCKSAGSLVLLAVALAGMFLSKFTRTYVALIIIASAPWLYMFSRSVGGWNGDNLVAFVKVHITPQHAGSLETRFGSENLLVAKALLKPVFGWGPGGRNLVYDENGKIVSIPDGLWTMTLGAGGIIGLVALFSFLGVPPLAVLFRFKAKYWSHPAFAGAAIFTAVLLIWSIDNLMNAMINPIYIVGLGGLSGIAVARQPISIPALRPREASGNFARSRHGSKRRASMISG